jgi:hypothetical protein|tara:strand:+ start:799 stop:921 length:123 start_codon:yes stop_codon:yes gene_type:complete
MVKTIKELKDEEAITDKEELELTLKENLVNELIKLRLQNG